MEDLPFNLPELAVQTASLASLVTLLLLARTSLHRLAIVVGLCLWLQKVRT